MTRDQALCDDLEAAIALVGASAARMRLGGLLRLVRLADEHPALRQGVVTVLGAYLRRPVPTGTGREARAGRDTRRAVLGALRDHLRDPAAATTWCGLDLDLRGCTLAGDLSGIVVTAGRVRLDRVTVAPRTTLDLTGARVAGGLLSMDRLDVAGRLDASGLVVDGGEASLDRLLLADGGEVVLDRARLTDGGVLLREGRIGAGTLSLRGARVDGGILSLHETRVEGGEVRLDGLELGGGCVHVTAATVATGALHLDDARVSGGVLSLTMTAVHDGRLGLAGARVDGGVVRFDGFTAGERAEISWGPFEPVAPPPAAEPAERGDIDLRGPEPADRWAWLRDDRGRPDHDVTTPTLPARQDVPSPSERAAS
jgi:hypothetical protein